MNIQKIEKLLNQVEGICSVLDTQIAESEIKKNEAENQVKIIDKAQIFFQDTAWKTQQLLKLKIEGIVTQMLDALFPDMYDFEVRFDTSGGTMEAELVFLLKGSDVVLDPMVSVGGGAIDAASFSLRCSLHILQPGVRKTLILDEPVKYVSSSLVPVVVEIIKKLSEELNIQFIVCSHIRPLIDGADKMFSIKQSGGVSYVE